MTRGATIRVLRAAGPPPLLLALAAAAAALTVASAVGLVAASAMLVSRSALVTTTAALAVTVTFVRLFALCRAGFRYLERYLGHLVTFRALTRLRVWFFSAIEASAPLAGGDLLNRVVADVDAMGDLALRVVIPAVAATVGALVAAGVLGALSPELALVLVAAAAATGVAVPLLGHAWSRRSTVAAVEARAALSATVAESLDAMAELVAWGREDLVVEAASAHDTAIARADRRTRAVRAGATAATTAAGPLAALVLLALAVPMVRAGEIEAVALAMVPLVALVSLEGVAPLAAAVDQGARTRTAATRLTEVVDAPPAVTEPACPVPLGAGFDLTLRDVTVRHGRVALPDLHVAAGEHVGILGPSGVGKSSLVAALLRLADYDGSIRLGGVELSEAATSAVRHRVAAVQQPDHLFDTTVRDNLLLADGGADDDEMVEALQDAHAWDFLPHGLDTRTGPDGELLSGGERQRVLIARALLARAEVLVLDEATAHLDGPTEAKVLAAVQQRQQGCTLIVIAHDADRLPGFDRIVLL